MHLCTVVDFQMLLAYWMLHNDGYDVGLHALPHGTHIEAEHQQSMK